MNHFIYTFFVVLFITACNSTSPESTSENSMSDTTNTIVEENNSTAESTSAEFIIESLPDTLDMPKSLIYVQIGDQKIELATINGIVQKFSQDDMAGLPENAVAACGAWWAGAGEYFYIASSEVKWQVFEGWMEETQEAPGYHWELLQEI